MDLNEILEKHQDSIMNIPGVAGIGIGSKGENPTFVVLVTDLTSEIKARLPKTIEGIDVIIEQSGEITAF